MYVYLSSYVVGLLSKASIICNSSPSKGTRTADYKDTALVKVKATSGFKNVLLTGNVQVVFLDLLWVVSLLLSPASR